MTTYRNKTEIRIGCASWSIPKPLADRFPAEGTHLDRYARRLNAVEINSSFYRSHRRGTYERWAETVPDGFRFAVKVPREITHRRRLKDAAEPWRRFVDEIAGLGPKLGIVLIQLPPSLSFQPDVAGPFFERVRESFPIAGAVAVEVRHRSWVATAAEEPLQELKFARVMADPAAAGEQAPGGYSALAYFRLHGSPKIYYSSYKDEYLRSLAAQLDALSRGGTSVWCIFDNTAAGAATENALRLTELLSHAEAEKQPFPNINKRPQR